MNGQGPYHKKCNHKGLLNSYTTVQVHEINKVKPVKLNIKLCIIGFWCSISMVLLRLYY